MAENAFQLSASAVRERQLDTAEVAVVSALAPPARLASDVLWRRGMTCPRCPDSALPETTSHGSLCPEHALAALEQVGRRLAHSRALLESAIERARRLGG